MVKCAFCGREESPFRGVHLIKNDGSISFFCGGKCRKNALNLRRDKKKIKWTEAYRITKERAAEKVVRDTATAEAKNAAKKQ
jgi:large subunit ribosomal protein L24e